MRETNETMMNQAMNNVEAPTLTSDPEERKIDMSFLEPRLGKTEIQSSTGSQVVSAGTIDESMLTEAEKKQVADFVKQIDDGIPNRPAYLWA